MKRTCLNKLRVICAIVGNCGQATFQPLSHIPIRRKHPREVETTVLKNYGEKSKSYVSRSINKDGIPDTFGPEFSLAAVLQWSHIVGSASAAHSGLLLACWCQNLTVACWPVGVSISEYVASTVV
jgi:hypothetical protein